MACPRGSIRAPRSVCRANPCCSSSYPVSTSSRLTFFSLSLSSRLFHTVLASSIVKTTTKTNNQLVVVALSPNPKKPKKKQLSQLLAVGSIVKHQQKTKTKIKRNQTITTTLTSDDGRAAVSASFSSWVLQINYRFWCFYFSYRRRGRFYIVVVLSEINNRHTNTHAQIARIRV